MTKNSKKDLTEAVLFQIPIFSSTKGLLLENIAKTVLMGKFNGLYWINTPNAEQVVQASNDDTFRHVLNRSTIRVPDGVSLVWSSKLLKKLGKIENNIFQRISGVDLVSEICQLAEKGSNKVFLLGGRGQVAEFAAQKIRESYPLLKIGYDEGFGDIKNPKDDENERILKEISDFGTEVLFVGYGAPWQEMWVDVNKKVLDKIGVKLVMVVGGAYDMISGNIRRAPKWMRMAGLEWLWRLILEPWRWRRQLRLVKYWSMVGKLLVGK